MNRRKRSAVKKDGILKVGIDRNDKDKFKSICEKMNVSMPAILESLVKDFCSKNAGLCEEELTYDSDYMSPEYYDNLENDDCYDPDEGFRDFD